MTRILTEGQQEVLDEIIEVGPIAILDLASNLGISEGAARGRVRALRKRGLVDSTSADGYARVQAWFAEETHRLVDPEGRGR